MSSCGPESGTCAACSDACSHKPGWFLPGEAERAAAHLGLTLQELFDRHLLVDYWSGTKATDYEDVFVLSPAIVGATPGREFPRDPLGTCVFFQAGRCAIHEVKPFECRDYWCGDGVTAEENKTRREQVALAWRDHQGQLDELLGREPESQGEWSIFDMLGAGPLFGGGGEYDDEDAALDEEWGFR
jgi:Fe-S-cluster containining protein